jgi:hypothetical protein
MPMADADTPETFENAEALFEAARRLIDRWCDRRQLGVLHMMLGGYLALNGLTDGWGRFYDALRNIRAMYGPGLPAEEQALLRDLLSAAEKMVYRDLPAGGERPRH